MLLSVLLTKTESWTNTPTCPDWNVAYEEDSYLYLFLGWDFEPKSNLKPLDICPSIQKAEILAYRG